MQKIYFLILFSFFTFESYSQSIIDTIITIKHDTLPCQVKYVNNYNVFYNYQKKDKIKDNIISRLDVLELIVNNKNVTILEAKSDSHINGYLRKSTLNKKYDVLLLPENTDSSLKILADSTFTFKKNDFFYLASKIQGFANRHRCKLVYPTRINNDESYSFNVKLYDATDVYYKTVLKTYNQKKIYFLRTNNNFERDEYELNINDNKIPLKKNEYHIFDLVKDDSLLVIKRGFDKTTVCDTISANKYFFVGNTDHYSFLPSDIGFILGAAAVGAAFGYIVIAIPEREWCKVSNFIGEFMKINIDGEKNGH